MNHNYPIYTVKTECQDCYKCVRHCPVKAIKVENSHAAVMPEFCVACGHCIEICPAKAKRVRDDTSRVRQLLKSGNPVYVSLAPSWISEFHGVSRERMIAALKTLGFAGVSETALGAQAVSAEVAAMFKAGERGMLISSACPAAVDYVRKYLPEFAAGITRLFSPALTHCRMLKNVFENDAGIVFIGPCVAKKNEADRYPELMNHALTFTELQNWLKEERIDIFSIKTDAENIFIPEKAEEGAIYPVEGGMIDTVKAHGGLDHVKFACLSGIHNINLALDGIRHGEVEVPVFIEMLACFGGCIHSPCMEHASPGLLERLRILNNSMIPADVAKHKQALDISAEFAGEPVKEPAVSYQELKVALKSIGKTTPEDELNCGGCGYDACRNFASALIVKKAEPSMCVSYLRKQAQKKANALLRSIPSGVVIVDRNLRVIESNRRFAELFGEDTVLAFDAKPGLAGADLKMIVPFYKFFENSLSSGRDIRRDSLRIDNRMFNLTVFNIEPNQVAGAVIFDITSTEIRREEIAGRAREVIDKNLATVQEIACKLGEHMAETEILLRSISENYADDKLIDVKNKTWKN
ncbi:MAG: [Fe-Fe] hydrogenase large subunit C-terminal domain-containing protein [Victivallaceae bacterium]